MRHQGHAPLEGAREGSGTALSPAAGRSLACGSTAPIFAWHCPCAYDYRGVQMSTFIRTPITLGSDSS